MNQSGNDELMQRQSDGELPMRRSTRAKMLTLLAVVTTVSLVMGASALVYWLVNHNEDTGVCSVATNTNTSADVEGHTTNDNTHIPPQDGLEIRHIAFGSCFKPHKQINDRLWKHFRANFDANASVWNWLGDNIYADTNDMNTKRQSYNNARNDPYYSTLGPVGFPKIPTTGTWDDHDYGWNNYGDNYACPRLSQNEFVQHFGIPKADVRHPSHASILLQGENTTCANSSSIHNNQQKGIYSAYMFGSGPHLANGSTTNIHNNNGIHLINLDARYHRSPTFAKYGPCQRENSTMLGKEQWEWLERQLLSRRSVLKIIASGTQILPPLARSRAVEEYCAYDGVNGTFEGNISAIGEDDHEGTLYESWAEMPQERTKLLRMVQQSIHLRQARRIVFLSGDQHWGEIMAKKIPATNMVAETTVYEVTASGIDQNWPHDISNSNRMQPSGQEYDGVLSIETAKSDAMTCSGDRLHICRAQANYGGIHVDWELNQVELVIYTPHEEDEVAARVILGF